MGPDFLAAVAN